MPLMFQPLARYADFQGRSRRSEYWLWALFLFVANSALTIIQFALMGGSMASVAAQSNGGSDAAAAGMLVFFVTEGERKTNRFGPDPKGEALNDTP